MATRPEDVKAFAPRSRRGQHDETEPAPGGRLRLGSNERRDRYRAGALSIASLLLLVVIALSLVIYGDRVSTLRHELNAMGFRGALALIGIEVLWTLTTVPSIPLMSLAGILYGPLKGTLYILIGGSIGFSLTFWLGRTLLKDRVRRWRDRYDQLQKMMAFVEKHGALSVFVVRLAPIFPLNLLNYGFGATKTPFGIYFAVSFLAFVPGAALYAGLGEVLWRVLVGDKELSVEIWVWLGAFIVLTGLLSYIAVSAHRRLSDSEAE